MHWQEVATRVTGISCPVFGVSWNPPEPEITIAQRVLTFLEDRRVLYNDYFHEEPRHCVQSVIEIRKFLTDELCKLPNGQGLPAHLRVIRAACREFLNEMGESDGDTRPSRGYFDHWVFPRAIGEFRKTVGVHIAILCTMYGLGIEGDLTKCLPPPADDAQ